MQHHVYVMFLCQTHDFVKRLPAVVLAMGINFLETDMAICGNKDSNGVSACVSLAHVLSVTVKRLTPLRATCSWRHDELVCGKLSSA
jgi:hypothetical protein